MSRQSCNLPSCQKGSWLIPSRQLLQRMMRISPPAPWQPHIDALTSVILNKIQETYHAINLTYLYFWKVSQELLQWILLDTYLSHIATKWLKTFVRTASLIWWSYCVTNTNLLPSQAQRRSFLCCISKNEISKCQFMQERSKFAQNYWNTCVHDSAKLRVHKRIPATGAAWSKQNLPLQAAYQESLRHHQQACHPSR